MGLDLFGPELGLAYTFPSTCLSGTVTGSLDGATVQPGAGFAAGKHSLQATFGDCEWYPSGFLSGGWVATIDAPTVPVDANGWTLDVQLTAARTRAVAEDGTAVYDDQATGSLRLTLRLVPATGSYTDSIYLLAPAAGLNFTNNRLGATATLRSGSYQLRGRYDATSPDYDGEDEDRFDALRFDVGGVPYLAQGSLLQKFDQDGSLIDASGELVLTSNGLCVSHIFGANTPAPGFYYEVDGVVTPVAARTVGSPAVGAAPRSASAVPR